uniref:Uncharacterized protein n=1 Tax=Glossina brevipalpis TaxID=37001 RepID=A0A1A9X2K7_9MUSC
MLMDSVANLLKEGISKSFRFDILPSTMPAAVVGLRLKDCYCSILGDIAYEISLLTLLYMESKVSDSDFDKTSDKASKLILRNRTTTKANQSSKQVHEQKDMLILCYTDFTDDRVTLKVSLQTSVTILIIPVVKTVLLFIAVFMATEIKI